MQDPGENTASGFSHSCLNNHPYAIIPNVKLPMSTKAGPIVVHILYLSHNVPDGQHTRLQYHFEESPSPEAQKNMHGGITIGCSSPSTKYLL